MRSQTRPDTPRPPRSRLHEENEAPPRYLTVPEIARRWRISISMVRKLIREGLARDGRRVRLSTVRIGRAVRVDRDVAAAYEALLGGGR